jgi:hypothetical protein
MSDEEPEAQDTDITDDELLPDDEPAPPPQDNAGSGRELRRKRTRSRAELKESEEFWQRVFADPVGRREVWRLLQAGHCFEERFACGPNGFPQTEATWFHAGEQAFVQPLSDLHAARSRRRLSHARRTRRAFLSRRPATATAE